jgi:hypothetical protein
MIQDTCYQAGHAPQDACHSCSVVSKTIAGMSFLITYMFAASSNQEIWGSKWAGDPEGLE